MDVGILILGELNTNVYILKKDGFSLVIDPADNADIILENISDTKPLGVLVTHTHDDHIGALKDLNAKGIKEPTYKEKMEIGPFKFEIINCPGHTSDSKTFFFKEDNIMFVGDFIFKNSIGRTDLETGDDEAMEKSLEMIKKYPNCTICPGHGPLTTLDYEKENNIYF